MSKKNTFKSLSRLDFIKLSGSGTALLIGSAYLSIILPSIYFFPGVSQ